MIMSNFIDEADRHAELYDAYTPRQCLLLGIVENLHLEISGNEESYTRINAVGVSVAEINWLKRTGHLLPAYG